MGSDWLACSRCRCFAFATLSCLAAVSHSPPPPFRASQRLHHLPGKMMPWEKHPTRSPDAVDHLLRRMAVLASLDVDAALVPSDFDVQDEACDAVFRCFEGDQAPPAPWTEEEAERYLGQLRDVPVWRGKDDERRIVREDVRRVCWLLCDEDDVDAEVDAFIRRFSGAAGEVTLSSFKTRLRHEASLAKLR